MFDRIESWGVAFALLAAVAAAPVHAATAVYIQSPSGDWIGAGQEYTFTAPGSAIAASYTSGSRLARVTFDGWTAEFQARSGETLGAGNHEGATRYPFNAPTEPGLSISSPGRGCNRLAGWFEVHEATFSGSSVLAFAVDFVQSCDGGPALFGAIRVNSSVPLQRPQPYARAARALVASEGDAVLLDGSASFDRASSVTYQWTQTQGTPVTLADATTARARFTAPDSAGDTQTLVFTLTVRDSDGNNDTTTVTVTVYDENSPRTRAFIDSDSGDWVGAGLTYWYDEANTRITTNPLGTVLTVRIAGAEDWWADFALPQGASWRPGMYAGAQRYPFQATTRPGLSFSGEGRGCNRLSGWFEIVEIEVVGSSVLKLAVDFVQHCEENTPALFGAIRINSAVPLDRRVPYAVASASVGTTVEGQDVVLDGSHSASRDGPLTYEWTQTGGPAVTIVDPNAAVARFTAPSVPPGGATLTLQLTVTDASGQTDTMTVTIRVLDESDPRTAAFVDSPAGDWIGGGGTHSFTEPDDPFSASYNATSRLATVSFDGWRAEFQARAGTTLGAGNYEGATRYPFNSSTEHGLSISSPGRGCNRLAGWFRIHEASFSGSSVVKLAVDFVQSCDGGPALFGAIRFNSAVPLERQAPYARAWAPGVVTEGDAVVLDGLASFDRSGPIATWQWTQLAGPAVSLSDGTTARARFTAPEVIAGGQTLRFQLAVTDADGHGDTATVEVRVHDLADPRTRVFLDSDAGDYIGGGLSYWYDEGNARITAGPLGTVLSVRIEGEESWTADFAVPDGATWGPGMYPGAHRYPFQSSAEPGLSFSGEGRGCNRLSGWFEIVELETAGSTVLRLAVDFVQHCEEGTPALFGAIRINSTLPLDRGVPYAAAVVATTPTEGDEARLDGSASATRDGTLTYQWTQTGGPTVTLLDATSAIARFTAPAVGPGGATLTFQLTVTNAQGRSDTTTVTVHVYDVSDARTRVFLASDAGDYIGGGRTYSYDEGNAAITAALATAVSVNIDGTEWWNARLALPQGASWQVGTYPMSERYPFQSPRRPGLDFSGEGRGCNRSGGWFEIVEIEIVGSTLMKLAVDFRQHCEGNAAGLFGAIRINSSVPVERPTPYAIAGLDVLAEEGAAGVALDGRQSYTRAGAALTYAWRQVAGPQVALANATTATPTLEAPAVGEYRFALDVGDGPGRVDTDEVTVVVRSRSVPRTSLFIDGEPGHYVSRGLDWLFTEENARITIERPSGGVSARIQASDYWNVDLVGPNGAPLQPGTYANAERWPFQSAGRPGLDYSGGGAGCNTVTGSFRVFQIAYGVDGAIESAAIDFEHHCEGTTPAARGKLRINFAPDNEPLAKAGPDQDVQEGANVVLDGRGSGDLQGPIAYAWRQTSGRTVTLTGATSAQPRFTAPTVQDGLVAETYTFALKVTDADGFTAEDSVTVRVFAPIDSDHDGAFDHQDAFPHDPAEWADSDGDGVGNNADAFPQDPAETVDSDHDGVGDNGDAFPADAGEARDTDGDGTGNNADPDDDNDGKPDSTEALAPHGGDGNQDGVADALQRDVVSFVDATGAPVTISVDAGARLLAARVLAHPDPGGAPAGVTFDRGFFGIDVAVVPGGAATVRLYVHGAPPPNRYFKYGPQNGGEPAFYDFAYNGATGAQSQSGVVVLSLVDGARGDADGVEDGTITDPGAPAWSVAAPAGSGGGAGGGGALGAGLLTLLLCARLLAGRTNS